MTSQNKQHQAKISASPPGAGAQLWQPRASAPAKRARTTAQGIVAALAIPVSDPSSPQPTRPLPVTSLHRLPRDTSMLYDIGRIDSSGRVANSDIVEALRWRAGDKLKLIPMQRAIVICASPDGLFSVPNRPRVVIPARARQRLAIRPGDHVLLAAAADHGLVIVYPMSALDEMISRYHSACSSGESA